MPRRPFYRHGDPRRPSYRVVLHDQPKRLELHPEIERDWTVREWVRRLGALAATAAVLGVSWAAVEGIVSLVKWLK